MAFFLGGCRFRYFRFRQQADAGQFFHGGQGGGIRAFGVQQPLHRNGRPLRHLAVVQACSDDGRLFPGVVDARFLQGCRRGFLLPSHSRPHLVLVIIGDTLL